MDKSLDLSRNLGSLDVRVFLYLFFHLPKTGGAAFFQNIERSLHYTQRLRLNYSHKQFYVDPRNGKLSFYESKEDFIRFMESLSPFEKGRIRFASGHDLPYGFHTYFPKEPKYFTFIREPISRTISLYNYQRSQHDFLKTMDKMDESHRRLQMFSREKFLIDGKIPSFEEWLERSYNGDYHFYFTMTRTFQHFGYLDPKIEDDSWDRLFQKFFFVGLAETLTEDMLYLSREIGVYRFFANRNASFPYVSYKDLDQKTREKIREKNALDFILYAHAKKVHASWRKQTHDFAKVVTRMKARKALYFFVEKTEPFLRRFFRPILKPIRDRILRERI